MAKVKRTLFTDIECFSSVDLAKAGVHKYAESPDFEILLVQYAWDDGPVIVLDLTVRDDRNDYPLRDFIDGLLDPDVVKVAHNSAFERTCLHRFTGHYLPAAEWEDTMVLAAMNGLPQSLDGAGAALHLQDQKIKEGVSLIRYFCKPCAPTKANGGRSRNLPHHDPDKWRRFMEYGGRDVQVEREIYYRLKDFPVTDFERRVWEVDAAINDRGILIDTRLAKAALWLDDTCRMKAEQELQRLTALENPNSVAQLKGWLAERGLQVASLNKAAMADLKAAAPDAVTRRVLELRQLLGKTSTKKYEAMLTAAGSDDRVRGIMQYYGAARTGRWAGRIVQPQNLPQNHLDDIGWVRDLVKRQELGTLEMLYDSVPDVLSQLIRTALVAKPGHTLLVADYSAIEARVIAYLAGEQWRLDAFAAGKDIYCASASAMFGVPVEKHGVNGHLRQKGKVAELACGYGGGVGALKAFGADKMGLSEAEMQTIVDQWRAASPTIPKLWREAEQAARQAIEHPGAYYRMACGVEYARTRDALRCRLPSGRVLSYWAPRIEDGSICFMGTNQTTRKWELTSTRGGKLVENIVQAFARDCLATALVRLADVGMQTVFHVHDEIVVEAPDGTPWQTVADIMAQPIDWAPGLRLPAEGYETKFYRKD